MPASSASSSPRTPAGRTTAALVPQGQLAGQPDVPLDRPVTSVGSGEQNRLQLASRTISRAHALFVKSGESVYVIDLASRTGVQVNGSPVRDQDLNSGDRVQVGKFVFRYRTPSIAANTSPPVSAPAAVVIRVGSPPVRISGRAILIGRRDTCDLILPEESGASNVHAVLFQVDHNWVLMDLESRAGTAVNGTSIIQQVIRFGDRLTIGAATVLFQPAVDQPAAVPSDELAPDVVEPAEQAAAIAVEAESSKPEPIPVEDFAVDSLEPVEDRVELEPLPFDERATAAAEPVADAVDHDFADLEPIPLDDQPVETIDPTAAATADLPAELADLPAEPVAEAVEPEPSDTTFGRMVSDFTAESTGPLVEENPPEAEEPVGFSSGLIPVEAAEPVTDLPSAEVPAEPVPFDEAPVPAASDPSARELAESHTDDVNELHGVAEPEAVAAAEPVESEPAAVVEPSPVPEAVEAVSPEPVAAQAAAAPADPAAPAAVPAAVPAWVPPVLDEIDDFVFVPDAEPVAAVPEVLFWGDDDLDAVTEAVVTGRPSREAAAGPDGVDPPTPARPGGGATTPEVEPPPEPSAPAENLEPESAAVPVPETAQSTVLPEPVPAEPTHAGEVGVPAVSADSVAAPEVPPIDGDPQPADAITSDFSDPLTTVASISTFDDPLVAEPVAFEPAAETEIEFEPVEESFEPVEFDIAEQSLQEPAGVADPAPSPAERDAAVTPEAAIQATSAASAEFLLEPEAIEISAAADAFLNATAHFDTLQPVDAEIDPAEVSAADPVEIEPEAAAEMPVDIGSEPVSEASEAAILESAIEPSSEPAASAEVPASVESEHQLAEPFDVAELPDGVEALDEPAPLMSWVDPAPAADPGDPAAATSEFSDPAVFVDPVEQGSEDAELHVELGTAPELAAAAAEAAAMPVDIGSEPVSEASEAAIVESAIEPSSEPAASAEVPAAPERDHPPAESFDVAELPDGVETLEEPVPLVSRVNLAPAIDPGDPAAATSEFSDPGAFVDAVEQGPEDAELHVELGTAPELAAAAAEAAAMPVDIGTEPAAESGEAAILESAIEPSSEPAASAEVPASVENEHPPAESFDVAELPDGVEALDEPAPLMSWVDPAPAADRGDPAAATSEFSDPAVFVDAVEQGTEDADPRAEFGTAPELAAAAAEASGLAGTIASSSAMESASGAVSAEHSVEDETPAIEPPEEPLHHLTSTGGDTGYQVTIHTDGTIVSTGTDDDSAERITEQVPPASTAATPDSAPLEIASGAMSVAGADVHGETAGELDWLPVHDHDEPPSGLVEIHDGEFDLLSIESSAAGTVGTDTATAAGAAVVELVETEPATEPLVYEATVIDDLVEASDGNADEAGWSIGAIHQALLATNDDFEPEPVAAPTAGFAGVDDAVLADPGPAEAHYGAVDVGPSAEESPGDSSAAADEFDFFEPVDSTPELGVQTGTAVQTETAVLAEPPHLETPPRASDITGTIATDLPGPVEPPVTTGGKPRGPSLFGFQFDGGSFLGGMPLPLGAPAVVAPVIPAVAAAVLVPAAIAPAAAPPATVPSPTFDAKATRPTGLSSIAQRPAPAAPAPVIPPAVKRPATPPRPVMPRAAQNVAPVLPGMIGELPGDATAAVIPPTSPEALAGTLGRHPLSTSFTAPSVRPRPTDIFSQVTTPIGVEVFGGPVVELGKVVLPDIAENPPADPLPVQPVPVSPVLPLRHRPIGIKVPILLLLIFALPAGLWWVVNRYVPTTATVVGSMSFAGLSLQSTQAQDVFKTEQLQLLESDQVRQSAQTYLIVEGQETGFTDNPAVYAEAIGPTSIGITGDTLQLTVNVPKAEAGRQQVLAVLRAMQTEDKRQGDKRGRAVLAADQARAAVQNSSKNIESIKDQRWAELGKAQEGPNQFAVEDQEKAAADARQLYDRAKSNRQANESLLADLRKQDTAKAVDPESSPDVIELRKQIRQYQNQLDAAAKRSAAGNPTGADDPLLDVVRQQLVTSNLQLDSKLETLKAAAAMSPAERDRQRNREVERLSIAETSFEKAEQTARDAAEAATAKAKTLRERLNQAQAAAVLADQLKQKQVAAEHEQLQLAETEKQKEAIAAETIGAGGPVAANVDPASITNPRPVIIYAGSSLMVLILVLMIIGELRQPHVVPGVRPAAAVPAAPRRMMPWPQPEQLQPLDEPAPAEQAAEF
jgi:pSer/pThr/pTyr-binding forkhead associated (FHA) protein